MTAVIYARYSSDNQREESIEGQIRECTAYAEKNGITVIKHNRKSRKQCNTKAAYLRYIDRAFSAKTDNRCIIYHPGKQFSCDAFSSIAWRSKHTGQ